ncbi:efflux RND transporter permease subunit [Chondrinema litorale]|uniref:efflux RND transporter permease subunit n=1 Tax=Chondrinema litorale TaxID=2994555 RepID=UPI002543AE8C|nr:efflux RND transporter permease subunit [Chondrinema litorale]UZR96398.1 efflux RND transporter permease subunit [Chondrinema litorale]
MSITEISIKRPLLICTIFTGLILFGIICYTNLNYNLLPSFDTGNLSIRTILPGASPQEIETKVTKQIEEAVSTVEGIDIITSSSLQNVSVIQITLKSGVDEIEAQQDVERKITQIKSTLPEDIDDPIVNRFSTDDFAVLNISVSANVSDKELYDLIDQDVKPGLSNVMGVGDINIIGGQQREIKILLDNDKLQMYRLSAKQVFQVIAGNTASLPGGNISNETENLSITINADYNQIELLHNLVVKDDGAGSRILLSEVATVSDAQEQVETINRINGKSAIGVQVFKTGDANAVEVSELVKEKLAELKELYADQDFSYEIASDQSIYTLDSADAVMHDLFLAVLIVGVVMLFFLHSLRSALFVLVAIPSAMIPTFILMYLMGFSLNLMTLLALSLVVGILVDDSIVVLENIFRHLEMGKEKRKASLEGRNEIGFTAVAITLVDVVVFLPMAFAGGLIGGILEEFSLVVVVSTLMSLFVAFTLTPMMASRFVKLEHLTRDKMWGKIMLGFEDIINYLKDNYGQLLHWTLHHKRYFFTLVIALMILSVALVPAGFIGASFVGSSDRGELAIQLETSTETPIRETNLLVKEAEKLVLAHPEVKTVYTLVGTQTGAKGNTENIAEMSVSLVEKTERNFSSDEFGVMARNEIEKIPGLQVTVIPTSITGNVNAPIQVVIKGTKKEDVYKASNQVKELVASIPGSDYVRFSTKGSTKQIQVTPNREKIDLLGLNLADVAQSIQLAFNGNDNIDFMDGDDTYNLKVEIDQGDKKSIEAIENLALSNRNGQMIKLKQVADVEQITGQYILQRTNRQSSITVTSSAVGRPSGDIVNDIKAKLEETDLPSGIEVSFEGDAKNQQESFRSLAFALIIAMVLVYMVMVSLYESLVYPFIVIFSVPVALIGALLALALTMNQLTIFTIIGMIMLLGLVTKNGILIVDFANHLKEEGNNVVEALIEAGKERLRPIIMTTFAMILGMLPLAISQSSGSEFKNGMAWVLIGGLTSSFLFTLFLVPSVYLVVENLKVKLQQKRGMAVEVKLE